MSGGSLQGEGVVEPEDGVERNAALQEAGDGDCSPVAAPFIRCHQGRVKRDTGVLHNR